MIISLLNDTNEDHLKDVIEDVKRLGTPIIRVYDLGFEGRYQAIEGSHRLRACEILGICPEIEYVEEDELIEGLDLDVDYFDGDTVATLGDWENYQVVIDEGEITNSEDY